MSITVALSKPGKGSGRVSSMEWDESSGKFQISIKHRMGHYISTIPLELEPGEMTVVLFSQLLGGWLTENEMRCLFNNAKLFVSPIIEIGSFMGKSTVCLGWGSRLGRGAPVYAIDPHRGSSEHKDYLRGSMGTFPTFTMNMNLAGLSDIVIPLKETSYVASRRFTNNSVGMVFIDGNHDQAGEDFDLWFPKLLRGGMILLHDSSWPGIDQVIQSRILDSDLCEFVSREDSITIGRKI